LPSSGNLYGTILTRAHSEYRAVDSRLPVQILIFGDEAMAAKGDPDA
jgi:hypothetical protein